MIDHVALDISDMQRSRAFYEKALQPLGYGVVMDTEGLILFGDGESMLGIRPGGGGKAHVAFASPDRKTVDAFHEAALAAGGEDNGAPGVREFHENYYAAFVQDPDGNNIEAVCQKPE
jgi:catechol 2,3-dioxygenase-like lactoylglutathione lyase family enzyme